MLDLRSDLYQILEEIEELAKNELNERGSISYTMPDGRHQIFIHTERKSAEVEPVYVVEPNKIYDNAHDLVGEPMTSPYNDFAHLLMCCTQCIALFALDREDNRSLPESSHTQDALTIYLCPQQDHTYSAVASLDELPFGEAIRFAKEQKYPVEVLYTRTDLNGSTCFEALTCDNLSDLLSTIDWCGKCRFTIHQAWDFDIDKTENKELIELFNDAWSYREKLMLSERDPWWLHPKDPAKVYMVSAGGVKHEIYSGSAEECTQFCEENNWVFRDENQFEWDLEIDGDFDIDLDYQDPSPEPLADKLKDAQTRAGSPAEHSDRDHEKLPW